VEEKFNLNIKLLVILQLSWLPTQLPVTLRDSKHTIVSNYSSLFLERQLKVKDIQIQDYYYY